MTDHVNFFIEIFSGTLTLWLVYVLYIFLRYLWLHRQEGYTALRPLIALSMFIVGSVLSKGCYWVLKILQNHGIAFSLQEIIYSFVAAGVVLGIGAICIIRVFAPKDWSYYNTWLVPLLISFGTSVIIALI